MILAALLVPTTMWWMSLRYYNAHKQAERTLAAQQHMAKSAEVKRMRETFFKPLESGSSVEFAPAEVMRTSWNGQTDPDGVWHDQRQQANSTLMQHGLPVLNVQTPMPDSPAPPGARRPSEQK